MEFLIIIVIILLLAKVGFYLLQIALALLRIPMILIPTVIIVGALLIWGVMSSIHQNNTSVIYNLENVDTRLVGGTFRVNVQFTNRDDKPHQYYVLVRGKVSSPQWSQENNWAFGQGWTNGVVTYTWTTDGVNAITPLVIPANQTVSVSFEMKHLDAQVPGSLSNSPLNITQICLWVYSIDSEPHVSFDATDYSSSLNSDKWWRWKPGVFCQD